MPNTLEDRVAQAENEAKRFLRRVREWRETTEGGAAYPCGKATATVKRASMDLTRALVEVRKGNTYS